MKSHILLPYSVAPELWEKEPLEATINGNVVGFDRLLTLKENPAPLVVPDIEIVRLANQGTTIFGKNDHTKKLPGGLEGGQLLVRETLARGMEYIEQICKKLFAEKYSCIWTEEYRSMETQKAGFNRALQERFQEYNIINPTDAELLLHGRFAATIFGWVRPNTHDDLYRQVYDDLKSNLALLKELTTASEILPNREAAIEEVIHDYITVSANTSTGFAANKGISLDNEHNAHAGGGAFDLIIGDEKGRPLNHVPYPFAHSISAMTFMEEDGNYEEYTSLAKRNQQLANHVQEMGYKTVDDFTFEHYIQLRNANRVRLRLILSAGGTFYERETWHFQLGRVIYGLKGEVLFEEKGTEAYDNSGGVGHTIIAQGPDAIAVWGGRSARTWIEKHLS